MVTRPSPCAGTTSSPRLSYKFQRLREQIRAAITSGEFAGQLPGERELGRRFFANAKTINKALCDLSSEGLLVRRIGRGTFVAPRNGRLAELGKTFSCVLIFPGDPPSSYRQNMLSQLQRAVEEKGASLDVAPMDRLVDGKVPLAGWPMDRRRLTAALACFPIDPLSGGKGHLSDECILESYRRHVPAVVIGALSRSARLNAVAPDYGDAGFRLAEHLFQAGCDSVVVVIGSEGREAEMVVAGAQASGIRQGRCVTQVVFREGTAPLDHLNGRPGTRTNEPHHDDGVPTGILCVGSTVLEAVAADESLRLRVAEGSVLLACVTDPGDGAGDRFRVTSYEVDPRCIAEWAARLLLESRPGQQTQEILIVGEVRVCTSHRPRPAPVGAPAGRSSGHRRAARCETRPA